MKYFIYLATFLFSLAATTGQAQVSTYGNSFDLGGPGFNKVYSGGADVNLGAVPGFSFLNDPESSEPIAIVEASLGGGANIGAQGCASISFDKYLEASLNMDIDMDRMADAMKTRFTKMMLTEIFSHPALASASDALREIQNFQLAAYQESCDLNEIMQDGQDRCIQRVAKDLGISPAEAKKHCESGTGDAIDAIAKNLALEDAFKRVYSDVGDVFRSLTDICQGDGSDSAGCFITALLPSASVCHNANCETFNNGPLFDMGKAMGSLKPLARSVIDAPGDMVAFFTGQHSYEKMKLLAEIAEAELAQKNAKNPHKNAGLAAVSPADNSPEYFTYDYQPTLFGQNSGGDTADKPKSDPEFLSFIQCDPDNMDPLAHAETFAKIAKDKLEANISIEKYRQSLEQQKESFLNLVNIDGTMPSSDAGKARFQQMVGLDLPALKKMLEDGLNCAMTHHLHIPMSRHVDLKYLLPRNQSETFYDITSLEVANFVTTQVLRYTIQKINDAQGQLAGQFAGGPDGASDSSGGGVKIYATSEECTDQTIMTLPQVEQAKQNGSKLGQDYYVCDQSFQLYQMLSASINAVKDNMENKLEAINDVRSRRATYAMLSSHIEDILDRQQEPNNFGRTGP